MEEKKNEKMFCFQCEQTAHGSGCTITGVCGKQPDTSDLQDELVGYLVRLAQMHPAPPYPKEITRLITQGLFTTLTNVNFDNPAIRKFINKVKFKNAPYDMKKIWNDQEDVRSLKSTILYGLKGIAAYACHASLLGFEDDEVTAFFYKALSLLPKDYPDPQAAMKELLPVVLEAGRANYRCMEILDQAHTKTFGSPVPTEVPLTIEKGPFIVVSGHDLHDLWQLLEQTKDKGVNVYTHGEMLPAHGYPKLKAYPHLKGNFGTAWQNQQKEFENIPGPVLFTTNCIMPVMPSYADRVFTTEMVGYPEMVHIDTPHDFTPVIEKALALGGYPEDRHMHGINGGATVTTGFARDAVLSHAEEIVTAVREGKISHFFLIGGCDGAKPGRNYYTEFAKLTPKDSLILTLACGKYRLNDLNLGTVAGFPRILDVGQCNDSYSAIRIALALADAFSCGINELPLTMVLSWYEQKAVAILLTLLYLDVKNILLGPSLPAFLSPAVLQYLVEHYNIAPIRTPEEDLAKILGSPNK